LKFFLSSTAEEFMKKAAIGFRVHSGWSAVVVVSVERGFLKVLRRERLQLVKVFSYRFRQPYHTGEKVELQEAGKFIAGVQKEAEELAAGFVRMTQIATEKEGYRIARGGMVQAGGRKLPELAKVLESHTLIHSADGELFREAIRSACERNGVRLNGVSAKELVQECARKVSIDEAEIVRRIREMRKAVGPPWGEDEKFAATVAWLALFS